MARKIPRTVRLSQSLSDYATRRVNDEAHPYESFSEYIAALVVYDRTVGVPHEVLSGLMARPERVRDSIIDGLESMSSPPSWMQEKWQESIKQALREACENCGFRRARGDEDVKNGPNGERGPV